MDEDRVLGSFPGPLADLIVNSGIGIRLPRVRAADLDLAALAIEAAQSAAVVVSLVQAPTTVVELVRLIRFLVSPASGGQRAKVNEVVIRAKGPNGSVVLRVNAETSSAQINDAVGLVFPRKSAP